MLIVEKLPVELFGLKLTVTPVGCPVAASVTWLSKPGRLIDRVDAVLDPATTLVAGADKEKSPVIESETLVLLVPAPFTPLIGIE
jgi:hypothetical protein